VDDVTTTQYQRTTTDQVQTRTDPYIRFETGTPWDFVVHRRPID